MVAEPPSSQTSVARARRGERGAWDVLHAEYAPLLHAVALAHGPHPNAEDVVQESFARAIEKLPELRSDAAFGPWICAIARNLATSGYRRQRRFAVLTDVFFARPRPTAEASQAIAAIAALPEAYSELLLMRLVEGLTGPEIAARLDRTPGSVRVSLHRGMKLLRERLEVDA